MICIIRIFICCLWIFNRNGIRLNLIPLWFHHDHDLTMITIMISSWSLSWFHHYHYNDLTMISIMISPWSLVRFCQNHHMYHYFAMINMMILTEFGHSLFCTKKPLRNLITSPPPPSEQKIKKIQTNKHSFITKYYISTWCN